MNHATSACRLVHSAGKLVLKGMHAGLLAAGVAAVAHYGTAQLRHEPVHFADTGMLDVHASGQGISSPINLEAMKAAGGSRTIFDLATGPVVEEPELSEEMQRVRDWVARRYRVSSTVLEPVLAQAEDSAREVGVDPLLIVAMMAIESSFNPFAESHVGAQGLMQVIPRFHMDKIGENAAADALFDPVLNVHVGTLVLAEGLRRFGSLQAALQYYGGARNDPHAAYSKKVLAMKQRIAVAAREGDA
ncbi:MAG: transglycosylase SLT domain-containing protein [Rhodocyclaceae bacterium]|jgi:hypothetical protein|nr:transglycosylase SLT domain-containing protein [Rhodocyclaceae bacterium]